MNTHKSPHKLTSIIASVGSRLLLVAAVLGTPCMFAQDTDLTEGFTPPEIQAGGLVGPFALSGFDTVNLYSGKLSFALPLKQIGARGAVGHAITLAFGSSWNIDKQGNYNNPVPNSWFNASTGYGPGNLIGRVAVETDSGCSGDRVVSRITRFTFNGSSGEVELRDKATNGEKSDEPYLTCEVVNINRGREFVESSGTGMTFVSSIDIVDPQFVKVSQEIYRSGTLYYPDGSRATVSGGKITKTTDRNGNEIHFEYNDPLSSWNVTKITDSIGRETTIAYAAGCPGTTFEFCDHVTYKGSAGATRTVIVRYDLLKDSFAPGFLARQFSVLFPTLTLNNDRTYGNSDIVVHSVVLPDNREYNFRYNDYGELAQVILPTGGRFEYDWDAGWGLSANGGVTDDQKMILRRVEERRSYAIDTGGTEQSKTTYSKSTTTDCQPFDAMKGTKVTVKHYDGASVKGREHHYFCGKPGDSTNNEIDDSQDYAWWKLGKKYKVEQADHDGVVLATSETTWEQRPLNPGETSWWGAGSKQPPVEPRQSATINTGDEVGTPMVSKQEFEYDAYNNRTQVRQYDYNAVTPTRRGGTVYQSSATYLDAPVHIRGLVLESYTCGGGTGDCESANAVSKTEYVYDDYSGDPLTNRSNVRNWDHANFGTTYTTRGNLTKVRRWRNLPTGIWIESHLAYDVLGNPVKATDPLGNVTTVSYSDDFHTATPELNGLNAYTFASSATRPLTQTISTQYDYYLGRPVKIHRPQRR